MKGKKMEKKSMQVRSSFHALCDDQHVETDLRYWLHHILHWHALLFAIILVIVIGMTHFNKANASLPVQGVGSF